MQLLQNKLSLRRKISVINQALLQINQICYGLIVMKDLMGIGGITPMQKLKQRRNSTFDMH